MPRIGIRKSVKYRLETDTCSRTQNQQKSPAVYNPAKRRRANNVVSLRLDGQEPASEIEVSESKPPPIRNIIVTRTAGFIRFRADFTRMEPIA